MNPSILPTIDASTNRWMDNVIALRREIHAYPELAFEERETAQRVQAFLAARGIPFRANVGGTGIVAVLEGGRPGPTVAIRADMDALPMGEPEGLAYASKIAGKMHSCGHDAHTAIVCGVAAVLSDMRESLGGRVMFLFQPAEETLRGAKAMLDDNVFADGNPDVILGFHNWPPLKTGTVGWHSDACMASSDAFDVTIKGTAGHGAHPHLAIDAIVGAAHFVEQVQTIVSREIAPISSAVLTIGKIQGGTARNIIASSVELQASVRTLEAETADRVQAAVRRILDGLKTGMRTDYDLDWTKLTPVLRNHKPTMARVLDVARSTLGAQNVIEMPAPSMGSEDYAWFAEQIPSAHLRIGSKIEGHETAIHRTDYRLNEDAIPLATRLMARAVTEFLD